MKRIVIDLDRTLTLGDSKDYARVSPDMAVVETLRAYQAAGFEIVIYTARNMRSHDNNVGKIVARTVPVILDWLERHEIPFDEVFVGKPWCGTDGFYVDDKAIRPDEFTSMSYEEIMKLIGSS